MPLMRLSLLAFLAWSSQSLADNLYAAAGISEPAHVTQFLARLKQAMAANDRAAVAAMVNYPLRVHTVGRPGRTCRNAAALRASYPNVFTPDVVSAVAAAKPDGLFARDQGIMIGQGEIWMNEVAGSMRIVTVNHTK